MRTIRRGLWRAYRPTADPCGENGEFHTLVYEAPAFTRPIRVETGEIVERDGFIFADVLPAV
jgi:diphthamide synthase (EF-2-diphthine--ammonia ligase)